MESLAGITIDRTARARPRSAFEVEALTDFVAPTVSDAWSHEWMANGKLREVFRIAHTPRKQMDARPPRIASARMARSLRSDDSVPSVSLEDKANNESSVKPSAESAKTDSTSSDPMTLTSDKGSESKQATVDLTEATKRAEMASRYPNLYAFESTLPSLTYDVQVGKTFTQVIMYTVSC